MTRAEVARAAPARRCGRRRSTGRNAAGVVQLAGGLDGRAPVLGPSSVPVGRLALLRRDAPAAPRRCRCRARPARRVDLHAHRVLLRAEDLHLRHAVDRRDALRQQRLGVLVHLGQRQRRPRSARGRRSAGRPGSPCGTTAASACPAAAGARACEMADCTSCAAASMLRSSANCSVIWVVPSALVRGHRVDAGDGGELLLQRRGHRRGHRLRARAGQRSRSPRWSGNRRSAGR